MTMNERRSRRGAVDPGGGEQSRPGLVPGARAQAGFTLVEALITLVITGIVGAAVVGLLQRQHLFYEQQDRLVYAQQSVRAAMDFMSSELRMVSRGDVQTAEADHLEVRWDLWEGVVCDVAGSDVHLFFHRTDSRTPSGSLYLEPRFDGSWISGPAWEDVEEDADETCADPNHGAPAGAAAEQYREVDWTGTTPEVGTVLRGFGILAYEFSVSDGEAALERGGQEIISPFEPGSPYFQYFRADGSELSPPVTGSALDEIAFVRVNATAVGQGAGRTEADRTVQVEIPFRN